MANEGKAVKMSIKDRFNDKIKSTIGMKKWNRIKVFLMVLPFLVFIFLFQYVPLLGWSYAFSDYRAGQRWYQFEWVGLKHFAKFFSNKDVFRVLRNTLVMSMLSILFSPLPVVFAILFNDIQNVRLKKFVQTITTLPHFISWIIVFGLAQAIFSANGLFNQLIEMLGGTPSVFGLIGDKEHVWAFQTFLAIWKTLGWNTIVYMAAITGIDQEMYDAAKVDGANKVQIIRHITIPGIAPTYLVLLLLKVSNLLNQGFDQYYQFHNSLVHSKIEVLDLYIYNLGFGQSQYSFSIATGMLKTLVALVLLFTTNTIARKIRGNSIV